jgi:hypothetical protein
MPHRDLGEEEQRHGDVQHVEHREHARSDVVGAGADHQRRDDDDDDDEGLEELVVFKRGEAPLQQGQVNHGRAIVA